MLFWKIIFWASCAVVFYNYAGYAIVVYLLNALKRGRRPPAGADAPVHPTVSFIVAAYNEEGCIQKKIENALEQAYPAEKMEYLFITDGSTDGTNDIIRRFPSVRLLYSPERKGKSAALNRVVQAATGDILIFSDANTILNRQATAQITRHYRSAGVGGVAGEKKVISMAHAADEVGGGEGAYWKYESFLKKLDSDFYSVVGAAGELFSVRRALFEPVPDDVILDDFVISLRIAEKGYRIIYEPDAYAMELPSFSLQDEQKRKVRIAAGGFQAIGLLPSLLAFWKRPKLSFLYISHRVLRWTLSPLCLVLALLSNTVLALTTGSYLYSALLVAQVLFYGLALAGNALPAGGGWTKVPRLCYYFVFMNLSVFQGFFRFLKGKQPAAWEKAKRSQAVTVESGIGAGHP